MIETTTKLQIISEIVNILGIKPDEIKKINADFQKLVSSHSETNAEMIKACKIYDPAAFLAGAMITTTMLDMVRNNQMQKMAERDRLEGNFRDVI